MHGQTNIKMVASAFYAKIYTVFVGGYWLSVWQNEREIEIGFVKKKIMRFELCVYSYCFDGISY